MSEADIKIAAYQDALAICEEYAASYGDLPKAACRAIIAALKERIREVAESAQEEIAA